MQDTETELNEAAYDAHLTMTISCSPGSFMYAGSECVEIWLGVLRVRRGRRGLFVPFPVVVAPFPCCEPASWSAVSSRVDDVVVSVAPAPACPAPAALLSLLNLRPPHATIVPRTKSEAITTSGICAVHVHVQAYARPRCRVRHSRGRT